MSYDPYSSYADEPRPGEPYDDRSQQPFGDAAHIKARVQPPAIGLIVVGILNLFFALYLVFNTLVLTVTSANELKSKQAAMFEALSPAMKEQADNQSAEEMKKNALVVYWPLTLFALLAAVLPIVGGIRIMSLKSYSLGVCAAILAAIPCISGSACCGLGEGIGIWAIVVLLNPDVKAAFH